MASRKEAVLQVLKRLDEEGLIEQSSISIQIPATKNQEEAKQRVVSMGLGEPELVSYQGSNWYQVRLGSDGSSVYCFFYNHPVEKVEEVTEVQA